MATMKLHEKLQQQGTRQKERQDIGESLVSENALAMRIRFAQHDARRGDLFTPRIAMDASTGDRSRTPWCRGRRARESNREDAPETFVLVVNGDYPAGASRSTMPE